MFKKIAKFRGYFACSLGSRCSTTLIVYRCNWPHSQENLNFSNSFHHFRWITNERIKRMRWKLKTKFKQELNRCINFEWNYNERKHLVSSWKTHSMILCYLKCTAISKLFKIVFRSYCINGTDVWKISEIFHIIRPY